MPYNSSLLGGFLARGGFLRIGTSMVLLAGVCDDVWLTSGCRGGRLSCWLVPGIGLGVWSGTSSSPRFTSGSYGSLVMSRC